MVEVLMQLLTEPMKALNNAKKSRDFNRTIEILVLSWVLLASSNYIASLTFGSLPLLDAIISIIIFFIGILFTIFFSKVFEKIMLTLGGKGTYFESLTAFSYSLFAVSFGFFGTSLMALFNQVLAVSFGLLLIAYTGALSFSTFYRSLKELFNVDYVTVFIAIGLLLFAVLFASFISGIYASSGLPFFQKILDIPLM